MSCTLYETHPTRSVVVTCIQEVGKSKVIVDLKEQRGWKNENSMKISNMKQEFRNFVFFTV